MISIWKLNEGECHMEAFDRKRKDFIPHSKFSQHDSGQQQKAEAGLFMTSIKEYREQSIALDLKAGRYMIVPRYPLPLNTHHFLAARPQRNTRSSS